MRRIVLMIVMACVLLISVGPSFAQSTVLFFTEEEKMFIKMHPEIALAIDPTFFPYEFIDKDGVYKGIAADYLALISDRTGIQFTVPSDLSWNQAYEKAMLGELDMLSCVLKTNARQLYFNYSSPYYFTYRSIFVKDGGIRISGMADLENKTVSVQKNSSHHSYLMDFPNIKLSLYDTVDEAIKALSEDRESVFVGNYATTSYLIRQYGITGVVSIAIDDDVQQALHFAVRKDWPELITILNKAIVSITDEEKIAINNKWIGVDNEFDYSRLIRIILLAVTIALLIFGISAFWIVRLKKEIAIRRKIEADLQVAKEEADTANQTKSLFLARMSHEIRTPLNAITGMSYIMKKTEMTTTQSHYLEKISRASSDMLTIINDILDFSKIESGKVTLESIAFRLDDVLERLINIIIYKVDEKNLEFNLQKDPGIPAYLIGDASRLSQILLNLVNNAIKFTDSGEINLIIRQVSKTDGFCKLEFVIQDTGIGMSDAQIEKLFTPFTQADSSINRRFGGTGLGLSIVKSLVELMGGEIGVSSQLNRGSQFVITMDFEEDYNMAYEDEKSNASVYFRDVRGLIVEKSIFKGRLLSAYLESFNLKADIVSSEKEALDKLRYAAEKEMNPYNLMIFGYDIPKDKGFAFIKQVEAQYDSINFLMILPSNGVDLLDRIDQLDNVVGITRPVIPSLLFNAIVELFRLQVKSQQQAVDSQLQVVNATNRNFKVLAFEDNLTNQFIVKSLLNQVTDEVVIVDNGKEGVEYFMSHRGEVDLILMDLHMPIMDGFEASRRIRDVDEAIPIIAMTADAITGIEAKCKQAGITSYISKPFKPEHFIQTIEALSQKKAFHKTLEDDMPEKPALDQERGIMTFGGNEALYKQVLKIFHDENQITASEITEAIASERYEDAWQMVHKLKSGSGGIGASKLAQTCSALQDALKSESTERIEPLIQLLQLELGEVLKVTVTGTGKEK